MKKLNLQLGSIKEMLTKEAMKKITGGYDGNYLCECLADDDTVIKSGYIHCDDPDSAICIATCGHYCGLV